MDITVEDQPSTFVAVLRERVAMDAFPEFYDRAYSLVAQEAATAGLDIIGPALGWYHDMPTDSVDLSAGFGVRADAPRSLGNGVEVVELPGGPAVVAHYVGSYDGLPAAWQEVGGWAMANAPRGRGDFLEVYVSDPSEVEPASNETRLVLPLVG